MASAITPYHHISSLVTKVIINNLASEPVGIQFAHQVSQTFKAPPGRSWFCLCRKREDSYGALPWRIRFRLVNPNLYMVELEETDPFVMSMEIFPPNELAKPARTVAPEHLAAPMHKHTILMLTTGHTRPNCVNCDCSKLLTDTCADDCVIPNSH